TYIIQRYADHRDLHSFPTRRSSDLANWAKSGSGRKNHTPRRSSRRSGKPGADADNCRTRGACLWKLGSRSTVAHSINPASGLDRSEEHTSELQSRGHLVCRLLLEKK